MQDESNTPADSEPSKAVAIPQTVTEFFGAQGPGILATFDPKTPEGARLLVQATLMELPALIAMVGKEIHVSHIYSNPAETINDDGEVETWRRIVLLDGRGLAWKCASAGIGKSIGIMALCRGNPPWIPPIKCTVQLQQLKGGKNWLQLIPDPDSLSCLSPKRARTN